jgi:hypothetical protein
MNRMSNELIAKHRTSSVEIKETNILNNNIHPNKANLTRNSKLSCINIVKPYQEKPKKNSKCNSVITGNKKDSKVELGEFWTNIEKRIKVLKSRISPAHSNKSGQSNQSRSNSVKVI